MKGEFVKGFDKYREQMHGFHDSVAFITGVHEIQVSYRKYGKKVQDYTKISVFLIQGPPKVDFAYTQLPLQGYN